MKYKAGDFLQFKSRWISTTGKVIECNKNSFTILWDCDTRVSRWDYNDRRITLIKSKKLKHYLPGWF